MKNKRAESFLHLAIHLLSIAPAVWLILAYFTDGLGVNPVQYLERRTGDYALILLLASLACTPLRIISGKGFFTRLRKPLGLYAFAYASVHLLLFLWLDYGWVWPSILRVFIGRPYLWAGFAAFVILVLLAATSTTGWQRRLKKGWQTLHSLVYLAGILVVLHFALNIKGNFFLLSGEIGKPLLALVILVLLLLIRTPPVRSLFLRLRGKIYDKKEDHPNG